MRSLQRVNLMQSRANFSVLDRLWKSSVKILVKSTTSQTIAIFVHHRDCLAKNNNLKEFCVAPKIRWSAPSGTTSETI